MIMGLAATPTNTHKQSKLSFEGERKILSVTQADRLIVEILIRSGCPADSAQEISWHLIDAELSGVESHGVMRVLQYHEQYKTGYLKGGVHPIINQDDFGHPYIDGQGGIGIPAMTLAIETLAEKVSLTGMGTIAVRNVGHTGRIGHFVEQAARLGHLCIIIGGSGRQKWRQATPFGGKKAILPTNPYAIGFPGGDRGPVVIDFATSQIAGGWLHSARAAGALVPEGSIIDKDGQPSRDPQAYFDGGAILPKGGPMGYGMALMAEMICDAMLGPAQIECNWFLISIDTRLYRSADAITRAAEEILDEVRSCPPSPGFERVEVPGERERNHKEKNEIIGLALPFKTYSLIKSLSAELGLDKDKGADIDSRKRLFMSDG
jgi:LDH2 family malate/lactate/ureidoglycolate dehydrogenase